MYSESLFPKLVLCACIAFPFAVAQSQQPNQTQPGQQPQMTTQQAGTFTGTLNGAGMGGATVTLTNVATGESKSAVTDANGHFTIPNLSAGTYRADVKLKSGLKLGQQSIEIKGAGPSQVQVDLQGPAKAAAVPPARLELHGRTLALETNSAEESRSWDFDYIRSLPLIDRQDQELITLMPGVTPPRLVEDRIFNPQRTRIFDVNGLPPWANLYNQDGVYDNEPFTNQPARTESIEALQALEVRTSNYNAQYGLAGGSWSSAVTRPGTNPIHGSLFEYNTNSYLTSGHSLFATTIQPAFNVNQFGGTAGGSFIPDKLFWFVSYEGFIQRGKTEAEETVPTPELASGNFSAIPGLTLFNPNTGNPDGTGRSPFLGNIIPLAQQNTSALQILALLPAPNRLGLVNNLVGNVPLRDDNHRVDGKIDHRFKNRMTGFVRYGYTNGSVNQGSLLGLEGSPLQSTFRANNAVGSLVETFKTGLIGEFRMGYTRYRNQILPFGNFTSLNGVISGFPNGVPSISTFGFSPIGLPAIVPTKQIDNIYSGASNWLTRKGKHSVRFGINVNYLESSGFTNPFFNTLSSFTFGPGGTLPSTASAVGLTPAILQANAFASFLTGAPTQAGVSTFATTPALKQLQYGAYAMDSINLFAKLYLEVGVRWDLFAPVQAQRTGGSVFFDPASNTVTPLGVNGFNHTLTTTDVKDVAPRFGFAYRFGNRFVARGGYGIHYFPVPLGLEPFNATTLGAQTGIAGGLSTTPFATPAVTIGGPIAENIPYFITSRRARTPYVQTYMGQVQGDLGWGFLLDVGYVGNVGRQLPFTTPLVGQPGTGLAGLPIPGRTALVFIDGRGLTSNYNSLQVNLTKRLSGGLTLTAAYTYSRALDFGNFLLNPFNRQSNYGPADWNRNNILAISHVWRLPFGRNQKYFTNGWAARLAGGWEVNGIMRWATGTPYTVIADPTACACLGVYTVPAQFAGVSSPNGSSQFNTALFSIPPANTFGILSRNANVGPDLITYNMAVFRDITLHENWKLSLRGEVYNIANTTNATNPVSNYAIPGYGSALGNLDGVAGRQFQVAARILF